MAAPGLVVLALVGFFVAVALALFFGVRSGVFRRGWLMAVVWIFLWNLVGGVLSIPARLVFGAGEMWLWWERPPAHPAYALAVGAAGAVATLILSRSTKLVKRIC
jgi:F0F1-type ATP synthase membrane subunit a